MRIFRHRGDIYVPATRNKVDVEQKVLAVVLAVVVVFTVAFLIFFGVRYNFSAKAFLAPDNMEVTKEAAAAEEALPDVSGTSTYLYILLEGDDETVSFAAIIQADFDYLAYKVCALSPNTILEDGTVQNAYYTGGGAAVQSAVSEFLGIDIDYYICQDPTGYKKLYDEMGSVTYTVREDIKYKDTSRYGFNIKIKAGEQNFGGDEMSKLLRYYINGEKNYEALGEILLLSLSQQVNPENYEKREDLFTSLISLSDTNLTIRNFTSGADRLKVASGENTGMNVYNVLPQYDGSSLTADAISNIKGQFS